jgi:hypothetical protein
MESASPAGVEFRKEARRLLDEYAGVLVLNGAMTPENWRRLQCEALLRMVR